MGEETITVESMTERLFLDLEAKALFQARRDHDIYLTEQLNKGSSKEHLVKEAMHKLLTTDSEDFGPDNGKTYWKEARKR